MTVKPTYRQYSDVDWATWQADETATLVFIIQGSRVLLIRKKRGLGAGKINGPGGRLEPDESPEACAVREVHEELCIRITDSVRRMGDLWFQFTDGYALRVFVYYATQFEGEPTETEEATPLWFTRDAMPYDEMWADDRIWLPHVLDGREVQGRFLFRKDEMLGYEFGCPNEKGIHARG